MTITGKPKGTLNRGAVVISRTLKATNGSRSEWGNNLRTDLIQQRVSVSFNTKDELEFKPINEETQKEKLEPKYETYKVSEIAECYAGDFKDFANTLVLEVLKNQIREEIVLQFENEQEFRRTLFTYKYFKMRNRLTHSSSSESSSEGSPSPSPSTKSRLSIDYSETPVSNYVRAFDYSSNLIRTNRNYGFKSLDYSQNQKIKISMSDQKENIDSNSKGMKPEYDLMQITDNNGVTHMSVENKNDVGEIDALIYTDVDYDSVNFSNGNSSSPETLDAPQKPQRRKQLLKRIKGRAPPPPDAPETEVVKGQVVRIGVERPERHMAKEATRTVAQQPKAHMGTNGYESDREEWRSRSTFSSSAFHSLARPARRALAAYYRLSSSPSPPTLPTMATRKPSPRNPRNLQATDYPKNFQSMHPEYIIVSPLQQMDSKRNSLTQQEAKKVENLFQKHDAKYGKLLFNKDYKKNPLGGSMTYLNISNRLYGLTDKLKEFGAGAQNKQSVWSSKNDKDKKEKGMLKPVIKKSPPNEGSKRPVVRTCSTEPPKKVTFSAFATVQVV